MSDESNENLSENANVRLVQKLHEVAKELDFMEKRGRNDHHHYDYVQAVDVTRSVRDKLIERNIIVIPASRGAEHTPMSNGSLLTTVRLSYEFVDTETGQSIVVPWTGVGADKGGDKGIYKAYTGGLKYMLLTLFLIPTTDDPERDGFTDSGNAAAPASGQHKDDQRPAAPTIPQDRAVDILKRAIACGMAEYDLEGNPGEPPVFAAPFKAMLALQGVERIGNLNVDQAEAVEAFLRNEEAMLASGTPEA